MAPPEPALTPPGLVNDGNETQAGQAVRAWPRAGWRGCRRPALRDRALYWDVAPLDHDALRTDILARYQYVVIVSLSLTCSYSLDD